MAEFDRVRRRKISAQGWLTRSVQKLESFLSSKEVKLLDLEEVLGDFDKRLNDYDAAEAAF